MFNKITVLFLVAAFVAVVSALTDREQFEDYKKKFNKQYTAEEEQTRFKNFQDTLKHIEENKAKFARGEVSHTEGINQFADLSADEWSHRNHGLKRP
ncbi:unnamed protein product [Psylliodes chrysocephalus]|uniref:Cathepsin propeptide inhibitor domain-containing protein n=1 Tax=Psylliodes chrysocephalus TaxID=3402493 RepID=A0A9P0CJI4_9CUCU|nr:unnamed protein product [Psylliodes chrysocephala]